MCLRGIWEEKEQRHTHERGCEWLGWKSKRERARERDKKRIYVGVRLEIHTNYTLHTGLHRMHYINFFNGQA